MFQLPQGGRLRYRHRNRTLLGHWVSDILEVIADVFWAAAEWDSILHSFYVGDYLESVHTTELATYHARDVDIIF